MENQHRKITGYRELTQEEIDLMNEIKAKGIELQSLIEKVHTTNANPVDDAMKEQVQASEAYRWAAVARTHFQEGCMALTRAVAKPGFF
jgi:hypothetical protein